MENVLGPNGSREMEPCTRLQCQVLRARSAPPPRYLRPRCQGSGRAPLPTREALGRSSLSPQCCRDRSGTRAAFESCRLGSWSFQWSDGRLPRCTNGEQARQLLPPQPGGRVAKEEVAVELFELQEFEDLFEPRGGGLLQSVHASIVAGGGRRPRTTRCSLPTATAGPTRMSEGRDPANGAGGSFVAGPAVAQPRSQV